MLVAVCSVVCSLPLRCEGRGHSRPSPSSSAVCFQLVHSSVPAKPLACDIQPPTHSIQPTHNLLPVRWAGSRAPFDGLLVTFSLSCPSPLHRISTVSSAPCGLHTIARICQATPTSPRLRVFSARYLRRRSWPRALWGADLRARLPALGEWRQIMMGTFKFKFITKQWREIVVSRGLLALFAFGVRVVV